MERFVMPVVPVGGELKLKKDPDPEDEADGDDTD
jgi:hypothetical protein